MEPHVYTALLHQGMSTVYPGIASYHKTKLCISAWHIFLLSKEDFVFDNDVTYYRSCVGGRCVYGPPSVTWFQWALQSLLLLLLGVMFLSLEFFERPKFLLRVCSEIAPKIIFLPICIQVLVRMWKRNLHNFETVTLYDKDKEWKKTCMKIVTLASRRNMGTIILNWQCCFGAEFVTICYLQFHGITAYCFVHAKYWSFISYFFKVKMIL